MSGSNDDVIYLKIQRNGDNVVFRIDRGDVSINLTKEEMDAIVESASEMEVQMD
jgi:hypothetical protein